MIHRAGTGNRIAVYLPLALFLLWVPGALLHAQEGNGAEERPSVQIRSPKELLDEADFLAVALGDMEGAAKLYRDIIRRSGIPPDVEAECLLGLGRALATLGRVEEARSTLLRLADRHPAFRSRAQKTIRDLEERSEQSPAAIELDWFADLRADSDLQAQLAELVIELSSPDSAAAARAAIHIERMGLLALPILRNMARASGDPELLRRAGAVLLRRGSAEFASQALGHRKTVEDVARWLLDAMQEDRRRFLAVLDDLHTTGAERTAGQVIPPEVLSLLRLAAGDRSHLRDDLRAVLDAQPPFTPAESTKKSHRRRTPQRPPPGLLEMLLRRVASTKAGADALDAEVEKRGPRSTPELLKAYVAGEAGVENGRRLAACLARHLANTAIQSESTSELTVPKWASIVIKATHECDPAFQKDVVVGLPARLLPAFFSTVVGHWLEARRTNRRAQAVDFPEPPRTGELYRILAERSTLPYLRQAAEESLLRKANHSVEALEALQAYLEGLDSEPSCLAGYASRGSREHAFVVPDTLERIRFLSRLAQHPSRNVRHWAIAAFYKPFSSRRRAVRYPDGNRRSVTNYTPELIDAIIEALESFLDAIASEERPAWGLNVPSSATTRSYPRRGWPSQRERPLAGRFWRYPRFHSHLEDTEVIYRAAALWIASASARVRERFLLLCLRDFERLSKPVEQFLLIPSPELYVGIPSLMTAAKNAVGGNLWKLLDHPGGATLLTIRTAQGRPLLNELPMPGQERWSEKDHRMLLDVVKRAGDQARPVMEREATIRFLAAYFSLLEQGGSRRSSGTTKGGSRTRVASAGQTEVYRLALRPAIADEQLSLGHRILALGVVTGTWFEPSQPSEHSKLVRAATGADRRPRETVYWSGGAVPGASLYKTHEAKLTGSRGTTAVSSSRRSATMAKRSKLGRPPPRHVRLEIPEGASLVELLNKPDPFVAKYPFTAVQIIGPALPRAVLARFHERLSRSPIPVLRAWSATLGDMSERSLVELHQIEREPPLRLVVKQQEAQAAETAEGEADTPWLLGLSEHRALARRLTRDPDPQVRAAAFKTLYDVLDRDGLVEALSRLQLREAVRVARLIEIVEYYRRLGQGK